MLFVRLGQGMEKMVSHKIVQSRIESMNKNCPAGSLCLPTTYLEGPVRSGKETKTVTKKFYTAVAFLSMLWFGWFIPTIFFMHGCNWNLHYREMAASLVSAGALVGLAFSYRYFTEEKKTKQRLELPKATMSK